MLKSVNKFPNALLVSNLKNCSNLLIFISGNVTWTGSEGDRRMGRRLKFLFFNFFL